MTSVKESSTEVLNADVFRTATESGEQLSKTKLELQDNPEFSYEYILAAGNLFNGRRVIIPRILQKPVSDELYRSHIGITKMKQLACRYVYWKKIDKALNNCQKLANHALRKRAIPQMCHYIRGMSPRKTGTVYTSSMRHHSRTISSSQLLTQNQDGLRSKDDAILQHQLIPLRYFLISLQSIVSDSATIFASDQFKSYCGHSGIFQESSSQQGT
jgi:hypothetical protein